MALGVLKAPPGDSNVQQNLENTDLKGMSWNFNLQVIKKKPNSNYFKKKKSAEMCWLTFTKETKGIWLWVGFDPGPKRCHQGEVFLCPVMAPI